MPLRSPKMYFCIFGFHRLVWWPKCTPASSSSFMVSAAIVPPSVGVLRRAFGIPWIPHRVVRGVCDRRDRAAPKWPSGRVLGVQPDVLLAEIARPHRVLGPAETEVDRDRVLSAPHDLADTLQAHALLEDAALDDRLRVERDADPARVDA